MDENLSFSFTHNKTHFFHLRNTTLVSDNRYPTQKSETQGRKVNRLQLLFEDLSVFRKPRELSGRATKSEEKMRRFCKKMVLYEGRLRRTLNPSSKLQTLQASPEV